MALIAILGWLAFYGLLFSLLFGVIPNSGLIAAWFSLVILFAIAMLQSIWVMGTNATAAKKER